MARSRSPACGPMSVVILMVSSNFTVALLLLYGMDVQWLSPKWAMSQQQRLRKGDTIQGSSVGLRISSELAANSTKNSGYKYLYPVPEGVPKEHMWRYSSHGLFWPKQDALTERFATYLTRLQLDDIKKVSDPIRTNMERVARVLRKKGRGQLALLFEKSYVNTLEMATTLLGDGTSYIITGDIPLLWLRDSSAQVNHYLTLLKKDPFLRSVVEGLIRRQMLFIHMDPYGSSFRMFLDFDHVGKQALTEWDFQSGRTIHVAMHNYEPDSLCYFVRLCHRYWMLTGQTEIFDDIWLSTARLIINTLKKEQNHNTSDYYYPELVNEGRGTPVCPTGMTWVGFRPSDDQCQYHYNIPVNMFIVVSLKQVAEIADLVYDNSALAMDALALAHAIDEGIHKFAVHNTTEHGLAYAYEVDGCGNVLIMDDANVPSLLSIPYIGYTSHHDPDGVIARNTRALVLSEHNPYFFEGTYSGIGSPHTPGAYVWHMSIIMQGLTSRSGLELNRLLRILEETTSKAGNVLHESYDVNAPESYTREWFGWASALFAELVQERLYDIAPALSTPTTTGGMCTCPCDSKEGQGQTLEPGVGGGAGVSENPEAEWNSNAAEEAATLGSLGVDGQGQAFESLPVPPDTKTIVEWQD